MVKCLFLIINLLYATVLYAQPVSNTQIKGLDEQVQDIKKDVLNLSVELSQLEEKLLYPSNTEVSVFVGLQGNKKFLLDSMRVKMDNKIVAQHVYTFKELQALREGGVQRIYTGNIKTGDHNLIIRFIGRSESGDAYQRSGKYVVTKTVGPKFVEVLITGSSSSDQKIRFKDW